MDTQESVVTAVKEAFERYRPRPLSLDVLEGSVHKLSGVWHIPVVRRRAPKNMYSLYDKLAKVEIDLEDSRNMKILLLPVLN